MTSSRPYLLRAFYDWIIDNDFTPYLVVNAEFIGVDVPKEYIEDGRIVLNISPDAVRNLTMQNDHVEFNARFAGTPYDIFSPIRAVTAIYAKENGRGMVFKDEDEEDDGNGGGPPQKGKSQKEKGIGGKAGKAGRPKLTVVK